MPRVFWYLLKLIDMHSVYLPGEEVLNYHIYCNEKFADTLILHVDRELRASDRYKNKIERFYYTRYYYPGHHIRLRVRLQDGAPGFGISFNSFCRSFLVSGEISNLALQCYFPEYGKYGKSEYPLVEEIFELQSVWAISQIKEGLRGEELLIRASTTIGLLILSCLNDYQGSLDFLNRRFIAFENELKLDSLDFRELRKKYRGISRSLMNKFKFFDLNNHENSIFIQKHRKLLHHKGETIKYSLLSNLIHMLCNKVFQNEQRRHEMMIYYFLIQSFNQQRHKLDRFVP